jgi:hypothetical protein
MKRYFALLVCFVAATAIASTAMAAADIGVKGVGVRAGVVDPENLDATVGFGFFVDLGTFHPNVAFETYVGYWSKSIDVGLAESSFRDIAVGAKGEYMFPLSNPTIRPFVGAGVSAHFLHGEASFSDMDLGGIVVPGMSFGSTETKVGLDLGGGLRAGVADRIDIIGEAWYNIVSDMNQLGITGGLLYKF